MMEKTCVAISVNHDRGRHSLHFVLFADIALRVIKDRIADWHLVQETVCLVSVLIHVDRQDGESEILVLSVQVIHQWHFLTTGPAPGRPEVEHYHFATEIL